jgi:CheY-like chemotaxis protein
MEQTPTKQSPFVLVVEDEPFVRMMGADMLEDAGFEVLMACNADEALRVLANRSDVGVVFTDVEMPGSLDGLDLAWRIHRDWPQVGVVVTSGRSSASECALPDDGLFVAKPYAAPTLVREIKEMMRRVQVD